MDPLLLGGIGAGVGAIGGAIQGELASRRASRQAKRLRKSVRTGTFMGEQELARRVGTVLSTPEYLAATKFARGFFGMGGDPRADLYSTLLGTFGPEATQAVGTEFDRIKNAAAREQGLFGANFLAGRFGIGEKTIDPTMSNITQAGSLGAQAQMLGQLGSLDKNQQFFYDQAKAKQASGKKLTEKEQLALSIGDRAAEFARESAAYQNLAGAFEGAPSPEMDALSQQFVKGLQQAQMSRGLFFGGAGAAAEASGLAAYKTGLQMQMLPLLLQLAENPLRMANVYGPGSYMANVFANTGGQAAYGSPVAGAMGMPVGGAFEGGMAGLTGGLQAGLGLANTLGQYGLTEAQTDYYRRAMGAGPSGIV